MWFIMSDFEMYDSEYTMSDSEMFVLSFVQQERMPLNTYRVWNRNWFISKVLAVDCMVVNYHSFINWFD